MIIPRGTALSGVLDHLGLRLERPLPMPISQSNQIRGLPLDGARSH